MPVLSVVYLHIYEYMYIDTSWKVGELVGKNILQLVELQKTL